MATTATIYGNGQPQAALITIPTVTEGSVEFHNVAAFRFKDRLNATAIRYAFLPSIVVTGAASGVATLPAGAAYQSPLFDTNGGRRTFTMYFAVTGVTMDIEIEVV